MTCFSLELVTAESLLKIIGFDFSEILSYDNALTIYRTDKSYFIFLRMASSSTRDPIIFLVSRKDLYWVSGLCMEYM